jgi:HEAT repeat protein
MTTRSHWGVTPRQSIEAESVRRGRHAVIAGCCDLIGGDDADGALILALGGPPARRVLDGDGRGDQRYWLRVWAVRGLLWVWDDSALAAVHVALRDPAWRVREMAAKVVARHRLGDSLPIVAELRDDPVPRVRAAAARALTILTGAAA